jgi:amino acid transporter
MTGKKLTTLRLAAATYFLVAGGPYGLEELVESGGYGRAALLIVITPILFSFPTALMVGELASAIPEEGGYYAWVKRALGPFGGFVEAWHSLCASFFDMAIYPTLFVTYLARAVPGADTGGMRIGLGLAMIALCTAYNLRGARSVGNASLLLSAALLGPFLVLALLAATGGTHPEAVAGAAAAVKSSEGGLGAGLLIAMWNFMGWDNSSTFAGEVENPQRTYPRAVAIAVLAVMLTYLFPVVAAAKTGMAPAEWSTGAWFVAVARVGGAWLGRAIVFGGVLCGIGMYNALLLSYSRVPAALAEDGLLPKAFARTNARGVPVLSVIVCSVLYSIGLLFSFRKLVEIDLIFYGIALILEFVALLVLRIKEPDLVRPFRVPGGLPIAALLGLFPTVLFGVGLYKEVADEGSHTVSAGASLAALIVGAVVWYTRARAAPPPPPSPARAA